MATREVDGVATVSWMYGEEWFKLVATWVSRLSQAILQALSRSDDCLLAAPEGLCGLKGPT